MNNGKRAPAISTKEQPVVTFVYKSEGGKHRVSIQDVIAKEPKQEKKK